MSTAEPMVNAPPATPSAQSWRKWIIAITVSFGAILEIIDTSIVNVALPDMQGNLGATLSEIGWVITGYAVANAIIIPLTAWLGDYFGRKRYWVFSLIGFTAASVLCGISTNLPMLVAARILQGLFGGGLLAKAQSILFETFPPAEQGIAQAIFGIGVIVGPVIGPTLGGYLTDTLGWRWIFFINIPFGILAVATSMIFLPEMKSKPVGSSVDWWGIVLLTVAIGSLQTFLEQGEQYDWFGSSLIVTLGVVAILTLGLFIWRELATDHPAVDLRVLRHKSLAAGSLYSAILGMGLYGALFAIPIFAQNFLNYTAMQTGMLLLPGALASAFMMPILGKLVSKFDARLIIGTGALLTALVMFWLSHLNPNSGESSLFGPLLMRGVATTLMFLPLSMATIGPLPREDIPAASGFYNLSRQLGGSIGIAGITTFLSQRENYHRSILVSNIDAFNQTAQSYINQTTAMFQAHGFDPVAAHLQAMKVVDGVVNRQSAVMSFADIFWIVGIIFIFSTPLLFFLGKGAGSKDAAANVH